MKFKNDIEAEAIIEVQSGLKDKDNLLGSAGQLLSSTGSQVSWVDASGLSAKTAEAVVQPIKANEALSKGDPLYIVGFQAGQNVNIVAKADASNSAKMPVVGLADDDYSNQDFGTMTAFGSFNGAFDTTGGTESWSIGDIIYVKPGGGLTNVKPTGTNLIQNIAIVSRVQQNTGELEVIALGRTNDVPNLPTGRLFVGTATNTSLSSNVVYIDEANDRVGIGTASPTTELNVSGNIAVSSGSYLSFIDSNLSYNKIGRNTSAGGIQITTGGSATMNLLDNGNVGIGTTSPGEKLEVVGNIRIDSTSAAQLFLDSAAGNDSVINFQEGATQKAKIGYDNSLSGFAMVAGSGPYSTADMVILDSGKVGIGTTSPNRLLHLQSTGDAIMQITSADGSGAYIDLGDVSDVNGGRIVYDSGSNLILNTASAERLRITSAGNVGIGTTNPARRLHVSSSDQSTARIRLSNTNTGSGGDNIDLVAGVNNVTQDGFSIYNATSNQTQLVIQGSGNVGIGTTSPVAKFEVTDGSSSITLQEYTNGAAIFLDGVNGDFTGGDYYHILANGSSYLGLGGYGGGSTPLNINSSGNIGIGTTSPTAKLDVRLSTVTGKVAEFHNSVGYGIDINVESDGGVNTISSASNQSLAFATNGSSNERIRITTAGNVGIGTTSPTAKLEVASTGTGDSILVTNNDATSDAAPVLTLKRDSASPADGDYLGQIKFKGENDASQEIVYAKITAKTSDVTDTTEDGLIETAVKSGGSNVIVSRQTGTDLKLINGVGLEVDGDSTFTGSVGVGGSPGAKLDVNAGLTNTVAIFESTDDKALIILKDDNTSTHLITKDNKFSIGESSTDYDNFKVDISTGDATFAGTVTSPTFLGDLNGTINTATTAVTKANATNDTTVATTAFVQNLIGTIPAGLVFQGTWNAATNTPTLTSGSGTTGHFYIVSTDGSTNLDGITDWKVGDWAVFVEQGASDQWEKVDNSSVLDGSGTGQTLPLWSGSGTSNTLTNSRFSQSATTNIITGPGNASSDKSLSIMSAANTEQLYIQGTGEVVVPQNYLYVSSSAGAYINGILRARSGVTDDGGTLGLGGNGSTNNLILTSNTSATFSGDVKIAEKLIHSGDTNTYIQFPGTNDKIVLATNGSDVLTLDAANNATFAGSVHLDSDSAQLQLGDDNDMQIYHNGSNGVIDNNTGDLILRSDSDDVKILAQDDVLIRDNNDSTEMAKFINGGAVELYYNGSKKFETYNTGVGITGSAYLTSGNLIHFDNGVTNNYAIRKNSTNLEFKTGGGYNFLSGNATFAGDVQATGLYVGATNTSFDFYNNGTTYLNGTTTVDAAFTQTGGLASTFSGDVTATANYTAGNSKIIYKAQRSGGAVAGDWSYDDGTTDMSLGTSTAHSFSLKTGNTRALTINNSQNATFAGNVTVANTTNPYLYLNDTNAGAGIFQQEGNTTRIGSDSNTQVALIQNNATAVTIDTSKNVGIGTTSPSRKLEVSTDAQIVSKFVGNTSNATGFIGAVVEIETNNDARGRGIYLTHRDSSDTSDSEWYMGTPYNGGGLSVGNAAYGTSLNSTTGPAHKDQSKLFITEAGNVGIGTTSPLGRLQINEYSVALQGNQTQHGELSVFANSGDESLFLGVKNAQYPNRGWAFNTVTNGVNSDLQIKEHGATSVRMTLESGGNVGIGQSNPSYKLDVAGNASFDISAAGNNVELSQSNGSHTAAIGYTISGKQQWSAGVTNGGDFSISRSTSVFSNSALYFSGTNGAAVFSSTATATNFILSSDKRKKTKIKDLTCDNIDVNWKSFELKENQGEYRTGVIAQELEEVHPEFVNTDKEGFKSVKYIDLLIAKIAELEARLEKLEK